MRKNAFVLTETIVVITVLCVIMITLYAAYSSILIKVNKKSLYDNTEYIYKTNIIREYLENTLESDDYETNYYVVCSNAVGTSCYKETTGNYQEELFKALKVEAVYIIDWNSSDISDIDLSNFEATTQSYIKSIDYEGVSSVAYRIVVMYQDENNNTDKEVFQYATLRFGSRGQI